MACLCPNLPVASHLALKPDSYRCEKPCRIRPCTASCNSSYHCPVTGLQSQQPLTVAHHSLLGCTWPTLCLELWPQAEIFTAALSHPPGLGSRISLSERSAPQTLYIRKHPHWGASIPLFCFHLSYSIFKMITYYTFHTNVMLCVSHLLNICSLKWEIFNMFTNVSQYLK